MEVLTEEQKKLHVLKAQAVRQALIEVLGENRAEIIKRAHAKLTAMGVEVTEGELESKI